MLRIQDDLNDTAELLQTRIALTSQMTTGTWLFSLKMDLGPDMVTVYGHAQSTPPILVFLARVIVCTVPQTSCDTCDTERLLD